MELFIVWFSIFVIPFAHSENKTNPTQEKHLDNVTQVSTSIEKINITLPSEGGTLLAISPELVSKDKQLSTLLALDKEAATPKKTLIKPRKGVGYITADDNYKVLNASSTKLQNITNTLDSAEDVAKQSSILPEVKNRTLPISNSTEVPKKPLILSYEALVNADKHILDESKLPILNPSPKTLSSLDKSQIPSPNEDAVVKVYPSKVNSHPGMIMPIVITILVVPMFAIFGYMALKRGQEAWKNRHYKRMDFLLDGMYND